VSILSKVLPKSPGCLSVTTLAGVLRLAHVPAELLLDVGLGIDGPAERAHRDFEFTAAECTDCNDRRGAKPLDDLKIALVRRVVLLYHRPETSDFSKCIV
jgi:hypothetical protein